MSSTPVTATRRSQTLDEQLKLMREVEIQITQRRIEESYQRILKDADEALDIKQATSEGGQ